MGYTCSLLVGSVEARNIEKPVTAPADSLRYDEGLGCCQAAGGKRRAHTSIWPLAGVCLETSRLALPGWSAASCKTLLVDFTSISSVCTTWVALSAAASGGGGGKGAAAEKTRAVLNSGELSNRANTSLRWLRFRGLRARRSQEAAAQR